jgi:hypothetical protein
MSIFDQIGSAFASDFVSGPTVNPQYQPPQRTWVGLTDEERNEAIRYGATLTEIAEDVEAKLKEKNI